MQKEPEGDSARVCVCVCVRTGGRERERERVGICENNIRLFRQNELYYCIQP